MSLIKTIRQTRAPVIAEITIGIVIAVAILDACQLLADISQFVVTQFK